MYISIHMYICMLYIIHKAADASLTQVGMDQSPEHRFSEVLPA